MKRLPIGKQVYRDLIEGNFVYVDKTPFLVELADSGIATFLARPRRFGKSLMVNTFKEMFKGSRELFKETFAYDNWDFSKVSPVIKLDMSVCSGKTIEEISGKIRNILEDSADEFGIDLSSEKHPDSAFRKLIKLLGQKVENRVVILIDEYDSPLLDSLYEPILPEIKNLLRQFYKVIKEQEEHIRFVFITGISKFSKVGVFSALNNLQDISLDPKYGTITGCTREEISHNFKDQIENACSVLSLSKESFWEQLKHYYNGYSWDGKQFVYNPFSLLQFFGRSEFLPFWMESGSPGFIVNYAKEKNLDLSELEGITVDKSFMSQADIEEASPESFLVQAGYLTIKESDPRGFYILDFPNYEVRYSFNNLLLKSSFKVIDRDLFGVKLAMLQAFESNNTTAFLEQVKVIFSVVTHYHYDTNRNEYFYSALLLMFLQAAGFDVIPEKTGNKGRLDLVLIWKNQRAYIMELKVDSAQTAIDQIKEKNYAGQYANLTPILIGLKIDFEERNVVEWIVEE